MDKKQRKFLERIVGLKQKELKKLMASILLSEGYRPVVKNGYLYAEGTIPVLLCAHLDTVHKEPAKVVCWDLNKNIVMSPMGIGGDDRCGIFMIREIIRSHKCSVVLLEDEETGGKGATMFADSGIAPEVNYILEFDRANSNDAVFYDCDNQSFVNFIEENTSFIESFGSFSDISIIAPALGAAAVNLSCGYYNAHTQHEYIDVDVMLNNIEEAKKLIDTPCSHFKYIAATKKYKYGWNSYSYRNAGKWLTPVSSLTEEDTVMVSQLSSGDVFEEYAEDLALDWSGGIWLFDQSGYAFPYSEELKLYETSTGKEIKYTPGKAEWFPVWEG